MPEVKFERLSTAGDDADGASVNDEKSSVSEATMNMLKAACGPGCLGLSYACSRAGLGLAPVLLLILQSCCMYNMHLLVQLKQHGARSAGSKSYSDLGHLAFGPRGRALTDIFVSVQQLGICCVYFHFVAANIAAILVNTRIDPTADTRTKRTQMMVCCIRLCHKSQSCCARWVRSLCLRRCH